MSTFISQGACLLGSQLHPNVARWIYDIKAASGGQPSSRTVLAANQFYKELVKTTLINKMISVNFFAPDNIIAADFPIIWNKGSRRWNNVGFGSGNLNKDGIQNSIDSYAFYGTGINPSVDFSTTTIGISLYTTDSWFDDTGYIMGITDGTYQFSCKINSSDRIEYACADPIAYGSSSLGNDFLGFISCNRTGTGSSDIAIYKQRITDSSLLSVKNFNSVAGSLTSINREIMVMAFDNNGSMEDFCLRRISLIAFHTFLTQNEAQLFRNLVYNLRYQFGGGY